MLAVTGVLLAAPAASAQTPTSLPAAPSAPLVAPTVKFKALFVAIPGYPETGNLYGAGAALQLEYVIAAGAAGAATPTLMDLKLFLPPGTRVHAAGFQSCPRALPKPLPWGRADCQASSSAGPNGEGLGAVVGATRAESEKQTVESFYAPGGGIQLLLLGGPEQPVLTASGRLVEAPGAPGAPSPGFDWLFSTVGAYPFVSLERLTLRVGLARGPKSPRRATYYLAVPKVGLCPKGGFLFRTMATFAGSSSEVQGSYRGPCPRRTARAGAPPVVASPPPAPPPPPCTSARHFTIHITPPRGVALRSVSVTLDGRPVRVRRGRTLTATIDLRGLRKGAHVVRITFVTRAGRRIVSTRTYHPCAGASR